MSETREFRCYGPPGCGKTTWLSRQAENAAKTYGGDAVVIASLTRAAAAEVGGRKTNVPDKNVGTLHSHAFHSLDRPRIAESKEGLVEWNEHVGSVRDKLGNSKVFDPENPPIDGSIDYSEGDRLLSEMGVYRQRMTPRELWRLPVQRFAQKWDDFKAQTGRLDFTDLIEHAIENCEKHYLNPAVFLLDEAQDMSKLEMTLARQWGRHTQTFVIVGDPWQNLYQWRGSDPEAFTAGDVAGVKILDQSYRVPAAVQAYSVDWISKIVRDGDVFPTYKPRDEVGEVLVQPHTWGYPDPLIREFEGEIEKGRSVMLLASCTYMLNPIIATLRERGIPFHNPYRVTHGGWNPLRYSDRVLAFLRPSAEASGDRAQVWSLEDLAKWTEVLAAKGTMPRGAKSMIEGRIAMIEARPRFDREELAAPLDLQWVLSQFEEAHHDSIFDMDLDWLLDHTRESRRRVIEYPVAVAKKYGVQALAQEPKVIVGTIHSVKGGQADSVYVFPDLSHQGMEGFMRPGPTQDAIYRQFYVAFTRARQKLVLLSPHGSDTVTFYRPKGTE